MNRRKLLPILIILLGLLAYSNSFKGVFVFDDIAGLVNNLDIRRLDLAAFSSRPVLTMSLALNYAVGAYNPAGYHLVNLVIHILAGLCLYGIVKRTLMLPRFESRLRPAHRPLPRHSLRSGSGWRPGSSAPWLAFTAASLWVVHPLQTSSVTYIVQRGESLMGLFYLFSLYCLIRGTPHLRGGHRWYTACICSCALGMGTKEVMITAPVMLFTYDLIFLSGSLRRQIRARWGLYIGLAATWTVLAMVMIGRLHCDPRASYAQAGTSPLYYALTQTQVITHYLKLCFLPRPLCLDYAWPLVKSFREVIGPAMLVIPLGLLTLVALWRCPILGYLGLWFFGILAPTSSFIPRPDPAFEHRMYLCLAAVVIVTVLVVHAAVESAVRRVPRPGRLFRVLPAVFLIIILTALVSLTLARNSDYASEETMWRREIQINPGSPRAYNELALGMVHQNRFSDVIESAAAALWTQYYRRPLERPVGRQEVLSLPPGKDMRPYVLAHTYIGISMHHLGRFEEAIEHYRIALSADPSFCDARNNLALVLFLMDKTESALEQLRKALQCEPCNGDSYRILGDIYTWQRKYPVAIRHYELSLQYKPDDTQTLRALAWVLSTCEDKELRDGMRAVGLAIRAARITNFKDFLVLDTLAAAYARVGRFNDAVTSAKKAFDLIPETDNEKWMRAAAYRLSLYERGESFTREPIE